MRKATLNLITRFYDDASQVAQVTGLLRFASLGASASTLNDGPPALRLRSANQP